MEKTAAFPSDGWVEERAARIISEFGWGERVLYAFSKNPRDVFASGGYARPTTQWTVGNALKELVTEFPTFTSMIRGRRVVDYGCGDGFQSIGMAKAGAAFVLGVDIERARLDHGRRMARNVPNVRFADRPQGEFDVAVSLNSFEHFPRPEENLAELADAIAPGGKILITFGSPWLSPYGSHMNFFTPFPWVNVVFTERTVFKVRQLYRDDSSRGYLPTINKMTIRRFEQIIAASGLEVISLEYKAVKNLPVLSHIPGVREFFINRVNCILTK